MESIATRLSPENSKQRTSCNVKNSVINFLGRRTERINLWDRRKEVCFANNACCGRMIILDYLITLTSFLRRKTTSWILLLQYAWRMSSNDFQWILSPLRRDLQHRSLLPQPWLEERQSYTQLCTRMREWGRGVVAINFCRLIFSWKSPPQTAFSVDFHYRLSPTQSRKRLQLLKQAKRVLPIGR